MFKLSRRVGCVIPAGGWGTFANGVPKVLESLAAGESKPILIQVVRRVIESGIARGNIVVVANSQTDSKIIEALENHGFGDIAVRIQYDRFGPAQAAVCALSHFKEKRVAEFLVVFGDMPRWSAQTIRELILLHRRKSPVISMVTIRLTEGCPASYRDYGIVIRKGGSGGIQSIMQPKYATEAQKAIPERNPSLYVLNANWFTQSQASGQVQPEGKGDGLRPEWHFTGHIRKAHRDQRSIEVLELPPNRILEAMGVNNQRELLAVRVAEAQNPSGS